MAAFHRYSNNEPHKKFKNFIMAGISHDADQFRAKVDTLLDFSPFEELAYKIQGRMQSGKKAAETAAAATKQQKAAEKGRKEDAERMMGIRPIISPRNVHDIDDEVILEHDRGAQCLGKKPSSRSG